jgi:putative ABC transport system substrate-binding protein
MRRREFIAIVVAGVATWSLPSRAQQGEPMRRIGVLMTLSANSSQGQARVAAFRQTLEQLGWIDGSNVRIDIRWGEGDADRIRNHAVELAALGPNVILANGSAGVASLLQATRTVPIVFVVVPDPVGAGVVDSLARPGGNATGFLTFDYSISAKWVELLKEIAPGVKRVAVLRDPTTSAGIGQWGAVQTAAASVGVEVRPVNARDAGEIEHAIAAFAGSSNGGLVVAGTRFGANHPDVIVALAARYKLPAVYYSRYFVTAGGLISYGPDLVAQYRRAAAYVDSILKGEKPANLPVQAPTKYELVINLKTAKALELTIPPTLLARADEVIE